MNKKQPATKHDLEIAQEEIAQATNNALATEMKTVHSRMDKFDSRMDGFDSRMDKLDTRMDKFDSRMDKLDTRMDGMEKDITSLKSATAAILKVVDSIEARLKRWEQIPDKVERLHKRVFN